jgi:hypothetical protein
MDSVLSLYSDSTTYIHTYIQVSDLSGLSGLSALAVLRLNHNRVEHLIPERPRNAMEVPTPTGLMTLNALEVLQV